MPHPVGCKREHRLSCLARRFHTDRARPHAHGEVARDCSGVPPDSSWARKRAGIRRAADSP
ncbi:hypothetical protein A176_007742 [Myxococcus hansupus]|uniref:Uncharacterized protein n=1 Tax=Pseudomyxococcus hansupus TaxID=1297742 RepID=A0A0H4WNF7_9BACT|nr:hypothetical protein A176_000005 [Myxococcus hansupus]AKQ70830.1 hypothetical protein A176_007742 [Myxococcus hansupus]